MLQDTEDRNVRRQFPSEEAPGDIRDNHRHGNRRLRVDKRNLLYAPGLRSRDESVAYDIAAYLGGSKVLAKVMRPRSGKGKKHRDA